VTPEEEKVVDEVYLEELRELAEKYAVAKSSGEPPQVVEQYGSAEERFIRGVTLAREARTRVKEMLK
jgi:hypothetical protein